MLIQDYVQQIFKLSTQLWLLFFIKNEFVILTLFQQTIYLPINTAAVGKGGKKLIKVFTKLRGYRFLSIDNSLNID